MALPRNASLSPLVRASERVPPHAYFLVSAVSHYLGPSFAVLLFTVIAPPGMAWLRIVSAGLIFGLWRRPWRFLEGLSMTEKGILMLFGVDLAAMNMVFYEAIARLPLATVGAIEFLGPVLLAAAGLRTLRNGAALVLTVGGVAVLTDARIGTSVSGYIFAFANCALFVGYILLGHRIASGSHDLSGIDGLAGAMIVASFVALPFGFGPALPAFFSLPLIAAAVGVGITSSVVPYVCDQMAMRRLPRASFALLLSLLPATATVMGLVLLNQKPNPTELIGIALVIAGVGLHRSGASPTLGD